MSVRTISKTSRASSCAVASRVETNATSVAARRSVPIRSMAVTLAVAAKRASSSTLPRGRRAEMETSIAKLRMSSTLRRARTSSGTLRRVGPVRKRSNCDLRSPGGTFRSASSRALLCGVSPLISRRQSRSSTRLRRRETSLSRTLTPGSRTLWETNHAVALSNRMLGRSVPVQQSAYNQRFKRNCTGQAEKS